MRKTFAGLAICSALIVGCESADHEVETEKSHETTVEVPATVTEKTTTEVDVHDDSEAAPQP